jgi:hypothetical protein
LSVLANGSAALTYQWLRNGNPVSGATNSTLTIPWVDNNDVGSYTVVADSCLGSTTSQPASVAVTDSTQSSPCLHIERGSTPGTVVLSWTAFYGLHWILQETSSLNPPGPPFPWVDSSYSATLVGPRFVLTVPASGAARFFQLRHP